MMARAAALAALAVASEAFMPPVIPGFCHHSQPARIVCAFMARVIRALCFVSRWRSDLGGATWAERQRAQQ